MSNGEDTYAFEALLDYLKRNRGFDFTGYKRNSVMRRVQKRMQGVGIESYSDYIDYLEVHPDEFEQLFNTVLINVTSFFRDPPAWEYLAQDVIPHFLAGKKLGDSVRVWSAGGATGEEAYTIAMLLAEAMSAEQFRERVKIYVTDVDGEALSHARAASYSARDVASIPPPLLGKYFDLVEGRYVFNKDLRRNIIFGRHDLVQDAPISRVDLLVCRNTLMYFNAETQARILARFHFALNDSGFLFLGKAEMLLVHADLFTPEDLRRRLFVKVPRVNLRDQLLTMVQGMNEEATNHRVNHVRVREASFDAGAVAQISVDLNGSLMLANERARALFGLTPRDLGRPIQDLELSYRPVELRSLLEQAYAQRRPIHVKDVESTPMSGTTGYFDVQIIPLPDMGDGLMGVTVTFTDVTYFHRLQSDLQHSNEELEAAYEELQSASEELETTNEELQSTVEELETTNEELQSTNEELETMNEELQSTNEELQTINEELRQRSDELNQVNGFLESILTSMRGAVVVVDGDLHIHVWNHRAEDLWGLRAEEVQGKHFLNLDIGLPVGQLRQPIRASLSGETEFMEVVLSAMNRRGKTIQCRVTCTPLIGPGEKIRDVLLLMEEE
jgi:two-component system CheB/CheR fusion protein